MIFAYLGGVQIVIVIAFYDIVELLMLKTVLDRRP